MLLKDVHEKARIRINEESMSTIEWSYRVTFECAVLVSLFLQLTLAHIGPFGSQSCLVLLKRLFSTYYDRVPVSYHLLKGV